MQENIDAPIIKLSIIKELKDHEKLFCLRFIGIVPQVGDVAWVATHGQFAWCFLRLIRNDKIVFESPELVSYLAEYN